MGLNCKKQVGKMKSIIVKVENDLEKERQLMKVSPHTRDFSHELGDTI